MTEVLELDPTLAAPTRIDLGAGGHADVVDHGQARRLRLFATDGALLLEYDAASGRMKLFAAAADLEIAAARDVTLRAGRHLRMEGREVSVTGSRVRLAASSADAAAVTLTPGRVQLAGEAIGIDGRALQVHVLDATLKAERATSFVGQCKLVVDRLETTAKTVFARARNVYRTVEELIQTHAGRTRTVIDGAHHLQCGRARLIAKDDFNIDGKHINLG